MTVLELTKVRCRVKVYRNAELPLFWANLSFSQDSGRCRQTPTHKTTSVSPGEHSLQLTLKHQFQFEPMTLLQSHLSIIIGGKDDSFFVQIAVKSCSDGWSNDVQMAVKSTSSRLNISVTFRGIRVLKRRLRGRNERTWG